jgi:pimeloyl-ACP methyl ester carboxylesterase
VDPSRIVVIGHSMGGWAAALTLEHDPAVMAGGLISAANVGVTLGKLPRAALVGAIDANIGASAGLHALSGTSPEALADEALRNAETFDILLSAKSVGQRPLLVVTSDDGLAGSSLPLGSAVQALDGGEVTFVHLPTDHSYSDQRIALEASVLRWLENLPGAPAGL